MQGAQEWWSRNPDVVFRVVAGERLLVPVRGEAAHHRRLFTLNPLGQQVWELLETGLSFENLCTALRERYPGTPAERVEADTRRFLEELEKLSLLRRSPVENGHGL